MIRPVKPEATDDHIVAAYHTDLALFIDHLVAGKVDALTNKPSAEIASEIEAIRASLQEVGAEVMTEGTEEQLDKIAAAVAVLDELVKLGEASAATEAAVTAKREAVRASLAPKTETFEGVDEQGKRTVATIVSDTDKIAAGARAPRVFASASENVARVAAAAATADDLVGSGTVEEVAFIEPLVLVRPTSLVTTHVEGTTQGGNVVHSGQTISTFDAIADAMAVAFNKATTDTAKIGAVRVDMLSNVPEDLRLQPGQGSVDHNDRVVASLREIRAVAASAESGSWEHVSKALLDGLNDGDRISASFTGDDPERVSAAAALCLPGQFDYSQHVCVTDVRPIESCGIFELLPLSGDGSWPLNWYPARTLADVTPLPVGIEGVDCPDGTPSDKDCYTLSIDCETAKQCKDVCAKYTCLEFNNFDLLTWRARLEAEFQLLQAATSRAREVELLNFLWKNSDNYISPNLYSSIQGFLSGFIKLLEGRFGQPRLDRSGVSGILYVPSWAPTYLAGALDMIPAQYKPSSLMNVTSAGDVDRYLAGLPGVSRVCYYIDTFGPTATGAPSQLYTVPTANKGLAPIALPAHPSKLTIGFAPTGAFRKLYRGAIDYGFAGGLNSAIMSPSTLRQNKRFMFSEEFYGLCVGPAADCFSPFTLTVDLCDNGGWAPAAAAKCFATA